MSGTKFGRIVLLVGILVSFVALVPQNTQAVDSPSWLENSPSLEKIKDLATGELPPYSINGNRDCQMRKVITRPGRLLPTPQTEQSHQSCVVDAGYGAYSQSGFLQRQGTALSGSLLKNTGGSANLIPIPFSSTGLQVTGTNYNGVYLGFTPNLSTHINTNVLIDGQVTHQVTLPAAKILKDLSGQSLVTRYESMSFSGNGQWMVVDVPFIGAIRVNTETYEVLPFGNVLNYNIGITPNLQTAITSDGRYAVVASKSFTVFRLYDLSTCGPVPLHLTTKVACSSVNLWPFMQQQIAGFNGVARLRFRGNHSLELYASYKESGTEKTSQYMLSAAGAGSYVFDYLALGDSYTSGEGAYEYKALTDTDQNKCHLSLKSYPYVLGYDLGLNQYESVACSGATINDLADTTDEYSRERAQAIGKEAKSFDSEILDGFLPGYRAQSMFVTEYKPGIVTVSAVGNDIGFSKKVLRCIEPDTCFKSYEDRVELVREINAQFPKLTSMYTNLKSLNPVGRVYAIGYPQVAAPAGNCAVNVRLNEREIEFTNQLVAYLNDVIEAAADYAGVRYVDIENALFGYRMCETDSWNVAVHGATAGNDKPKFLNGPIGNESFHPTAFGQWLIAQKILDETSDFTTQMPEPDLDAAPPAENSLEILGAQKTGRDINAINFDEDASNNVVYRQQPWGIYVDSTKIALKALSPFKAVLHSDPLELGTFYTDAQGNLSILTTVPATVPTGHHTLHLLGQNAAGEPVDIYKVVYVGANPEDLDGDGVPNDTDSCTGIEPAGADTDQDAVDDACDGFIDKPPLVMGSSSEKTQVTYSDPEGSFIGLVGINAADSTISSGGGQQSSIYASQIQPAGSPEPTTSQPQVAGETIQTQVDSSESKTADFNEKRKREAWIIVLVLSLLSGTFVVYKFVHKEEK